MEDFSALFVDVVLELLCWDVLAAVGARLRSHWTLHLLVLRQDQVLDVLATLRALYLPILTHWKVGLCVCVFWGGGVQRGTSHEQKSYSPLTSTYAYKFTTYYIVGLVSTSLHHNTLCISEEQEYKYCLFDIPRDSSAAPPTHTHWLRSCSRH